MNVLFLFCCFSTFFFHLILMFVGNRHLSDMPQSSLLTIHFSRFALEANSQPSMMAACLVFNPHNRVARVDSWIPQKSSGPFLLFYCCFFLFFFSFSVNTQLFVGRSLTANNFGSSGDGVSSSPPWQWVQYPYIAFCFFQHSIFFHVYVLL